VGALRLSSKITLAVVWLEKGSDRSVAVECQECAARPIEPGDGAVISHDLEDLTTNCPIAKLLRGTKIFLFTDISELRTVLRKMLVQLIPGAKTDPRTNLIQGNVDPIRTRTPRGRG
jgi:hypothetical protein